MLMSTVPLNSTSDAIVAGGHEILEIYHALYHIKRKKRLH